MLKIDSTPPMLQVPPAAHLPRLRETLADLVVLLSSALEPVRRFRKTHDEVENALRLAAGVHALNALDAARAVHNLSGTDYAQTLTPHFRTLFEVLVKIRAMRKDPARARAYLESEPFERHAMATERVKKSKRWAEIVQSCKDAVARNPALLKLKKVNTGKNNPPNFNAVARALRMDLETLAEELGMDEEDYLMDFGVPSLNSHTSPVFTKNFGKSFNADGSATMSSEIDPKLLLIYVIRSSARVGQILEDVLALFPDGRLQFEAEKIEPRLEEQTVAIRNLIGKKP
jgi:hypothetical protein